MFCIFYDYELTQVNAMTEPNNRRGRLYISENEEKTTHKRTTEARSRLYRLIAQFRKNAEQTDDPRTRTIFEYAVEIMVGLVTAFRKYEDLIDEDEEEGKSDEDKV